MSPMGFANHSSRADSHGSQSQAGSQVASCSTSVHSTMATQSETPGDPGLNSFKKEILIQLGVSPDLSDRSDCGLCQAYKKYKAYLQASKTYGEMISNKSWVGDKLMGADIIQLFVSKSFFTPTTRSFFQRYQTIQIWWIGWRAIQGHLLMRIFGVKRKQVIHSRIWRHFWRCMGGKRRKGNMSKVTRLRVDLKGQVTRRRRKSKSRIR